MRRYHTRWWYKRSTQPRKTFVSPTLENYWHRNNYKQYTHIFCSIHSAGFDLVIYFQHWLLIVHIYPRGPKVVPPGRNYMLDTYRTISILMFFADHKETRERRLSFCKSLTVNASIGNADKNACCWLKLIRYSLSACALEKVLEMKFLSMCARHTASFLHHIWLQRWRLPDDPYGFFSSFV